MAGTNPGCAVTIRGRHTDREHARFSLSETKQGHKEKRRMAIEIEDPYDVTGLTNEELLTLNKALLDKVSKGTLEEDGKDQLAAVKNEVSRRNL